MKKLALASLIMAASAAQAEVSFNAAATSNYVWRGMTQTNDASAIQGGADYAHESGLAAGVWTSSAAGDTETDYYVSFGGEAGQLSYEVGAIMYDYNADDADFTEAFIGVGAMGASATYYRRVNDNDDIDQTDDASYISLAYGMELQSDLLLDLSFGQTIDVNSDVSEMDTYDVAVSVTKVMPDFDFSLTLTDRGDSEDGNDNVIVAGENEFFVTVSKSF